MLWQRMATLHLICGLPGSGKSTLAHRLEDEGAGIRLSPDDWMLALGLTIYDDSARNRIEQLQWDLGRRLLAKGTDVILENGFWAREERDAYRAAAAALGATIRIHYLSVPIDELKQRIIARNECLPAMARVNPNDLDAWSALFQPPSEGEIKS